VEGAPSGARMDAMESAEHRARVRQARHRIRHVMRFQALVSATLVTGAVILFAAGIWVLGALVGLLAVLPVTAPLDWIAIWIRMGNPRHWPDPPTIRPVRPETNLPSSDSPQSPTGWTPKPGVKWSWFAPGFMIGWPTWFRARWIEARNFIR
jgi:hypothetical protein